MTLSDIGVVVAICTPLMLGGGKGVQYWAENEFVSADDLHGYEIRGLKREARKLKRMINEGQVEYQDDYLDLLDEIEELEDELG